MGIPRFFVWLKHRNYPGVLQETFPQDVDWLILDANSIIHRAHQQAYAYGDGFDKKRALWIREQDPEQVEKDFYNILMTLISNEVVRIAPQNLVVAVDGVAPQAKINQQRQRRVKAKRISERDPRQRVDPEEEKLRKPIVDTNRITPGTEFMFRLDAFLRDWFGREENLVNLGLIKVIYSSHLVPGEGEHKYLELLRSGEVPYTGTHVIHGMDADLFILSLASGVDRIFISREDIDEIVNIAELRLVLYRQMHNESYMQDFALLTYFIGNDFLPHQPSLLNMGEAIDALISVYASVALPLTQVQEGRHVIIRDNLLKFLEAFAQEEPYLLAKQAVRGFKVKKSRVFSSALSKDKQSFDYDIFRQLWYDQALAPLGDTSILELITGGPVLEVTPERIQEMALSYLKGLGWNLAYYLDGWQIIDLDYLYPYNYAPLFSDLVAALAAAASSDVLTDVTSEEEYFFTPIHQLLAVMPFESQLLLPPEVRHLMDLESPIYDMYPNQFVFDQQGTNVYYEGVVVIPPSEKDRIIAAVDEVSFPEGRWEKYQVGIDYVFSAEEQRVNLARKQREQMAKINQMFPVTRGRGRGRGRGAPLLRGRDDLPRAPARTREDIPTPQRGIPRGARGTRGAPRGARGTRGAPRGRGAPPSTIRGRDDLPRGGFVYRPKVPQEQPVAPQVPTERTTKPVLRIRDVLK